MARRQLMSAQDWQVRLEPATGEREIIRHYTLDEDDLGVIMRKRRDVSARSPCRCPKCPAFGVNLGRRQNLVNGRAVFSGGWPRGGDCRCECPLWR